MMDANQGNSLRVSALTDAFQMLSLEERKPKTLLGTFVFDGKTTCPGQSFKQQLFKEVQYVYIITQQALEALANQNLDAFDPLVSDTACQIRALMVTTFATKLLSDASFQSEVRGLLNTLPLKSQEIAKYAEKATSAKEKISQKSFYEFLTNGNFELEVSEEIIFLATAYFLTKSKDVRAVKTQCLHPDCQEEVLHDIERTNCKLIDDQNLLSVKSKEAYVSHGKRRLADGSCKAVQQAAGCYSDDMTKKALSYVRVVEQRNQLPAYYTLKAVFESFLETNTPLFVKVASAPHTVDGGERDPVLVCLFMKPDKEKRDFVVVKPTAQDETLPAVFIRGQRSGSCVKDEPASGFLKRFLNTSFMKIVKTFAAAHPQFTDKDEVEGIPLFASCEARLHQERAMILEQRREADTLGTSMKCQHLFTFVHMSATTLKAQKAKGCVVYEPSL